MTYTLLLNGSGGGNMWSLFGSFFYVLVVFALIIAVCWFALKMTGRVRGRGNPGGNLYLLESIAVGAQNMVQLVKAGEKYLVIGVTRERITLLCELDASQVKDLAQVPVSVAFKTVLERFMSKRGQSDEGLPGDSIEGTGDDGDDRYGST